MNEELYFIPRCVCAAKILCHLIGPQSGRHPRVLLERTAAIVVALRVPLVMLHQSLLQRQAGRRGLHRALERLLVWRAAGAARERHGHRHRRARAQAEFRGTACLDRRGPLVLLSRAPAAPAHLPVKKKTPTLIISCN